ncbi:MAG: hypothetical protein ABI411_16910 [Tahibacter sp.]
MRTRLSVWALTQIALLPAIEAASSPPLPDPQWGTADSTAYVPFDLFSAQSSDGATSALVLPDGRLVMAGKAQVDSGFNADLAITRVLATTGAPDPSFGGGDGRINLNLVPSSYVQISRSDDGKLWYGAIQTQPSAVIGRLFENGTVDNSFDFDGRRFLSATVFLDAAASFESAPRILPLPDGKALVVASPNRQAAPVRICVGVLRLNADGSTDPSFAAGAGRVCEAPVYDVLTAAVGFDIVRLADGRLLVAAAALHSGGSSFDMAVLRLSADGIRDASFGIDGWAFVPFDQGGNLIDVGSALAIDNLGRIVVAGRANLPSSTVAAVARLTANGQIDTTFGQQGRVLIHRSSLPLDTYLDAYSVAILPDQRIIVGGVSNAGTGFTAELTGNGAQDPTFGSEGVFDVLTSTSERTLVRDDYVYSVGTGASAAQPGNSDFTAVRRILPLFRSGFEALDAP